MMQRALTEAERALAWKRRVAYGSSLGAVGTAVIRILAGAVVGTVGPCFRRPFDAPLRSDSWRGSSRTANYPDTWVVVEMVLGAWEDEQHADVRGIPLHPCLLPEQSSGNTTSAPITWVNCTMYSICPILANDQSFHYEDQVAMTRGS